MHSRSGEVPGPTGQVAGPVTALPAQGPGPAGQVPGQGPGTALPEVGHFGGAGPGTPANVPPMLALPPNFTPYGEAGTRAWTSYQDLRT